MDESAVANTTWQAGQTAQFVAVGSVAFSRSLLQSTMMLYLVALVAFASPAMADVDRLFVRPGTSVVVSESNNKIELSGTAPPGTHLVTSEVGATGSPYWALIYSAPAGSDAEAALTFASGGALRTVLIEVSTSPTSDDPALIGKAVRLLFAMLVMAVILESAFAVLFNWRVFLEFFDGRGVRTLVMFVAAYLIVRGFHVDFVASLLQTYGIAATPTLETTLLTALVLAGGSASVNALMVALNLRENRKIEDVAPKPPQTKAWVAMKIRRKKAVNVVEVMQQVKPFVDAGSPRQLLGVVHAQSIVGRLRKYFWRDVSRVPMSAGIEVDPKMEYAFIIHGRDSAGTDIFSDAAGKSLEKTGDTFVPIPQSYAFAPGSVVDFDVTL
ncbi:hypothetical protein [Rhizobium sp. NZLR11]|uniref:hypothetical protein n=1 Tax=Rhizobium sp. NZLR11 TaxID=2731098 RepID=UPI001C83BA2E|nr:hypothetical protein [Rhizobium sp. NZLR11]MBX5212560.1 hypothetical protein [Rhizobium sp. NZLR11]